MQVVVDIFSRYENNRFDHFQVVRNNPVSWLSTMLRRLFSKSLTTSRSHSRILGSRVIAAQEFSSSSINVDQEVSTFLAERTVLRKNGSKEKRLFSDREYERRLNNLR